jgi:hypothetical protein
VRETAASLSALYIGKPFGSFWDYVVALTWGLATQTALTALASALDSLGGLGLVGRRLRATSATAYGEGGEVLQIKTIPWPSLMSDRPGVPSRRVR